MPDRHATPLLPCRPPADLADWVRGEAERRGVTITTIINEALQAAKDKADLGGPQDPPNTDTDTNPLTVVTTRG